MVVTERTLFRVVVLHLNLPFFNRNRALWELVPRAPISTSSLISGTVNRLSLRERRPSPLTYSHIISFYVRARHSFGYDP